MGHDSCCVVNCRNTGRNSKCKFYIFPTASWKLEQRNKWIAAVKRKNVDGSPWVPKRHDHICSDHFVGGKKANEQASPSYIPTIFPSVYQSKRIDGSAALRRYKRFIRRRNKDTQQTLQATHPLVATNVAANNTNQVNILRIKEEPEDMDIGPTVLQHMDPHYKICQTEIKQEDEFHNEDDGKGKDDNDQVLYSQVKVEFSEDSQKDKIIQQCLQVTQPHAVTNVTEGDSEQVDELHIKEEPEENNLDIGPTILQHMDSHYRTSQVDVKQEDEVRTDDDERSLCQIENGQIEAVK